MSCVENHEFCEQSELSEVHEFCEQGEICKVRELGVKRVSCKHGVSYPIRLGMITGIVVYPCGLRSLWHNNRCDWVTHRPQRIVCSDNCCGSWEWGCADDITRRGMLCPSIKELLTDTSGVLIEGDFY